MASVQLTDPSVFNCYFCFTDGFDIAMLVFVSAAAKVSAVLFVVVVVVVASATAGAVSGAGCRSRLTQ